MSVSPAALVRCVLALLALLLAGACGGGAQPPPPPPAADTTPPTTRATPPGGSLLGPVTVSLLCSDGDGSGCAATHYTLDGSEPSTRSPMFEEAILIRGGASLKFFSVDKAGNTEAVKTEHYRFDPPVLGVSATPPGGLYGAAQTVTLTCTPGTTSCSAIRYTMDGSTPSASSPAYTGPLTVNSSTTLRLLATDALGNASQVVSEVYIIDMIGPSTTASPAGGMYSTGHEVTLACSDTGGASCAATYYTLDGSAPILSSPVYSGPIALSTSATLRFFSVDTVGNAGAAGTEEYTIDLAAPMTTASPAGGTYPGAQSITLSCNDGAGAGCAGTYYTTNGTTPTAGSSRYTAPITVEQNTTLKFFSVDQAGHTEPVRTETYVIDGSAPTVSASPAGGTYAAAQTVTLTCSDTGGSGCQAIHYTVDGSTPTTGSPVYSAPLAIASSMVLEFLAVDLAGNTSSVQAETYVIDSEAPTTGAIPAGGTYASAQTVTLSCDDGAGTGCTATWYTVDGSTPTTGSPRYTGPLSVTSSTTLKFFSVDAVGNTEAVKTEAYVITTSPSDTSAQIAAVRSAPNGPLSQLIDLALVTYVKPLTATDPAGFFLQAEPNGPALFVAVDPATLSPAPRVGDRVSLSVTQKITFNGAVQATALSGFTRSSQGHPVEPLRVNVSAIDLPPAVGSYEHELISISGTLTDAFSSSGVDNVQAPMVTLGTPPGSPSANNLRLRMLTHHQEQLAPSSGCNITVQAPLWRFNATAQPSVLAEQDLSLLSCPAPRVMSAAPFSSTGLLVRFDRPIDPLGVLLDGSQFTFTNGLVATSATVTGREVRLTTSAQPPNAYHEVTVATSVRDTLGSSLDPAATRAPFVGFQPPAVLRITEVAPNILNNRDLVELQVLQGGSVANMRLVSDNFVLASLPNVTVATGDIIVVHLNPDRGGSDAPGSELLSKSEYPSATYPSNYDSAWDFHGGTFDLLYSNRVLQVRDVYGNVQDGVAFYNSNVLPSTSPSYASFVRALQAEGHWAPSSCGGAPCTYTSSPPVENISASWRGCSTDRTTTVRRISATDTHSAADWAVGPSSLGSANP
jgi:hypothetical protein